MVYKIFISHSGKDSELAEEIYSRVSRNNGIVSYCYEHDPKPGRDINEKVKKAIRESDAVVVLLTPNSLSSPYVQQEIGYAIGIRRQIIPVVLPSISKQNLAMLKNIEYIDFGTPEKGIRELSNHLTQQQQLKKEREDMFFGAAIMGIFAFLAWDVLTKK